MTRTAKNAAMLLAMVMLAAAGIALLIVAPLVGRRIVGPDRDATAVTRILQILAVVLLVGALFVRPYNPDTAAIPPSPNAATR